MAGVSREVMEASIQRLGGKPNGATDLKAPLVALLKRRYPKAEFMECGACETPIPDVAELTTCPGCGVEFEEGGGDVEATMDAAATEAAQKKAAARAARLEREIDGLVDQANGLIRQARGVAWDIGNRLLEMEDEGLWVARHPGGKSFAAYLKERFPFTVATARNYMRVARSFTRDQALGITDTNLVLISKAPPEDRPALVEQAKTAATPKRELAEAVRVKRAAAGLSTERKGHAATVLISQRVKPGVLAKGAWKEQRGQEVYQAAFEVGGVPMVLEDHGLEEGWVLKVRKPKSK